MYEFEDYIQDANRAQTPDELFGVFARTLSQYGFDKVLFGLLTDHKDIKLKAGVGVMENYPADWMKYYFENGFDKIDPIITFGAFQAQAFCWDDISKHVDLKPIQHKCLDMGREAGLNNGISIPLRGVYGQMAGISLATTEGKDACLFKADLMMAFCQHFYMAYKRLHAAQSVNPRNVVLTDKEKKILSLAALGKSDEDIADIIFISKHTVNAHLRNIYEKFEVNNRVLAVVKALSAGLIHI